MVNRIGMAVVIGIVVAIIVWVLGWLLLEAHISFGAVLESPGAPLLGIVAGLYHFFSQGGFGNALP